VRVYFDTSALVAALVQQERDHAASLREFRTSTPKLTSTHGLAELFATLTSGRLPVQFTPAQAEQSIQPNILGAFEIVPILLDSYLRVIAECGRVGARGGGFFDVLHLQAARIGRADEIITLNETHFRIFAPDLRDIIRKPR
jgi:predicted nucleic acid-binding protein